MTVSGEVSSEQQTGAESAWVCDLENGCTDVPDKCSCPPHRDEDSNACGEGEAAGCHFCAHMDIYDPCPGNLDVLDEILENDIAAAEHVARTHREYLAALTAKGSSDGV